MKLALQQGHSDGLCGLYAIANFLCRIPLGGWTRKNTLVHLLESCAGHGWFTPHHIVTGFFDYQLKAVLDDQIRDHQLEYRTQLITDVIAAEGIGSFRELAQRVLIKGGSIIGGPDSRDHWILLSGFVLEGELIDSDNTAAPIRKFTGHHKFSITGGAGVVIVPHARQYEKIGI